MNITKKQIIIWLTISIIIVASLKIYQYNQLINQPQEISIFIDHGHEQLKSGIKDACREYNLELNFIEVNALETDEEIITKIKREVDYGVNGILLAYLNRPEIYAALSPLSNQLLVVGDKCTQLETLNYQQDDLLNIITDYMKLKQIDIYYQATMTSFDELNKAMIEMTLKEANISYHEKIIHKITKNDSKNPILIFQKDLIGHYQELLKTNNEIYLFGCFGDGLSLIDQNEKIKMIYYNDYQLGYQSIVKMSGQSVKKGKAYFYLNQENLYDERYSDLLFF